MDKKARFYFTECILYVDLTVIKVIVCAAGSNVDGRILKIHLIMKLHNAKMN